MFKKIRSLNMSYKKQGYIYFTCLNYQNLSDQQQREILNLCLKAGGEHYGALFELVTSDIGVRKAASKHYISESTLHRIRNKFYSEWD